MKTFHLAISVLFFASQAFACGSNDQRYSGVPLTFTEFNSSLNSMNYQLLPSHRGGWVFRDGDGVELFFSRDLNTLGEPCVRPSRDAEPICGAALDGLRGNGQNRIMLTDSTGAQRGELFYTQKPSASFIIKPLNAQGQVIAGDYIRLTDQTTRLSDSEYTAGMQVQTIRNSATSATLLATTPMEVRDGKLQFEPSLVRCFSALPEHRAIELTGSQTINGNAAGEVVSVTAGGARVLGYRDGVAPAGAVEVER